MNVIALVLIVATLVSVFSGILVWSVLSFCDVQDSNYDKEMMEDWNYFKWIVFGVSAIWSLIKSTYGYRPKSPIDKEIAEEEKEISELEKHKEKLDTLAELKRRKERLFKDVHREESWECTACGDEFETLNDYGRHISKAHQS